MTKPSLSILLLGLLVCAMTSTAVTERLIDYVNTFIGSGGQGFGIGSVPPGAQVPFGVLRVTPDTVWWDNIWLHFNHFGGYYYGDSNIRVFSHTHLVGAGICDYGQVGVLPISAFPTKEMLANYGFRSEFSHLNESAHPGYYSVYLMTHQIRAELTATANVAMHKYRWLGNPSSTIKTVLFDIGHAVSPGSISKASASLYPSSNEIRGTVLLQGPLSGRFGGFTLYFVAKFPTAWTRSGAWVTYSNGKVDLREGVQWISGGPGTGMYLVFDQALPSSELEFSVGISTISEEQASINIKNQAHPLNFDAVLAVAEAEWEKTLAAVTIQTSGDSSSSSSSASSSSSPSRDDLVQFYSAMYRTHMAPTSFEEFPSQDPSVAPLYRGFDKNVHSLPTNMKKYYSDMSIWDTHRTEMPWLALLDPDRASDMANSLLLMFKQGGDLPRWPMADGYTNCMIGTHAIIILVDSYLKGARFDVNVAYEAMVQAATKVQAHAGRTDIEHYLAKGYVSYEASSKSASETLEYAYDDWALGTFAKEVMNRPEDAAVFLNRSENYRNVWAPGQQFFCARSLNGSFDCPFTWLNVFDNTYVEGDAWHWRWFVPQNPAGLISLFGSVPFFVDQLNLFMSRAADDPYNILPNPYYWAGNEPDIFAPWMFNFAGRPDLTQKWTRHQLKTQYSSKPDGLPGNDDFGTMSAWAIFASLGFYPQAGSDRYLVGSPMFSNVTIHRTVGDIQIIAHDASPTNVYVSRLTVNGRAIDLVRSPWFSHNEIHHGGRLEYWMSASPSL